jgi:nucleotide-binding universal stress UspA family protein
MKRETNNYILVPTDFSDVAECALNHAINVAQAYKNEITLLFILEEGILGGLFSGSQSEVMKDAIATKLQLKADEITKKTGIKVSTRIGKGKVYKAISEIANDEHFDSIIMGSHGASGFEQIVGSNASRTIQYAEVPVVVIKDSNITEKGYQKIVMPIDLTIETRQKVDWAIHLAKKFDSEIHVVYSKSNDEYLDRKIQNNIAQVEFDFKSKNVKYQIYEFKDGVLDNFATEIHNYANIVNADLILAMTHTEKGISEIIIGTLTQQLVNRANNVAIMCIHPRETAFTYDY